MELHVQKIEFELAHTPEGIVSGRAYVTLEDASGKRRTFRLTTGERDAIIKIVKDITYLSEVER
jgi:hypothetical protein